MASSFGVPRSDLTWKRQLLAPTAFAGLHFVQADLSRMTEAQQVARELRAEQLDLLLVSRSPR